MSKNRNNKSYGFIFEHTTVVSPGQMEILEESKTPDGKLKMTFKTLLQESNVKNANKRVYDNTICESIVNQLSPKANSRSLLMEIDHEIGGNKKSLIQKIYIFYIILS